MSRATDLLRDAAEALSDGIDPFGGDFLSEHDVTSAECMSLAEQLALGALIVARAYDSPKSEQGTALFLTIAEGA